MSFVIVAIAATSSNGQDYEMSEKIAQREKILTNQSFEFTDTETYKTAIVI